MTRKNLSAINKKAWEIRKKAAQKWSCPVMEIIWKECIRMAIEELKQDEKMSFNQWYQFYNDNQKSFNYIFYHNDIIQKNGKITIDAIEDAKRTTATYNILHAEGEDIKQLTLQKVLEKFQREGGNIKYGHRYSIYALCAYNALKEHSRMIKRSRLSLNPNEPMPTGFNDNSERIVITDDSREVNLLKIDLQSLLNDRQLRIISLREQGYAWQEIADAEGISRQAVHKNIQRIREIMIENNLISIEA